MRLSFSLLPLAWAAGWGCRTKATDSSDTGTPSSGDTGRPDDTSACDTSTLAALATPTEVGETPRANDEAEGLAICMGASFTASQGNYERIHSDMNAIRSLWHEDLGEYRPNPDLHSISVKMESEVAIDADAGVYSDWDCIHRYFNEVNITPFAYLGDVAYTYIEFAGSYNTDTLAALYLELPGVLEAEGSDGPGYTDGSQIGGRIDGDTYHYVFDYGEGDCEAGCTYHKWTYIVTESPDEATLVDTWDKGEGATDTGEAPDWLSMRDCP